MKCAPTKQDDQLSKLKFNSKLLMSEEVGVSADGVYMKVGELQLGKVDYIINVTKKAVQHESNLFTFDTVEFTTDLFKSSHSLSQKTLVVEIYTKD